MSFLVGLAVSVYAIVGGPGVGKTSIIQALQEKEEIITQEAATDYIANQQASGIEAPWADEYFQPDVLCLHLKREEEAKCSARDHGKGRIFTDRGILDGYVYTELRNQKETNGYKVVDHMMREITHPDYYKAVFYVLPFDSEKSIEQTKVRHEDQAEADRISLLTHKVYTSNFPNVIIVPGNCTPQERADFILERVAELEGEYIAQAE